MEFSLITSASMQIGVRLGRLIGSRWATSHRKKNKCSYLQILFPRSVVQREENEIKIGKGSFFIRL